MPESIAAVGEYFAADGVAAAGSEAVAAGGAYGAGTAAATADGLVAAGATAGEAATAGTALAGAGAGTAAAAGGTAVAGGSLLQSLGSSALGGVGSAVASSLLSPGVPQGGDSVQQPKTLAPSPMPDPLAQQAAIKKSIVEQTTRRGRASTVLTSPGNSSGRLGG